MKPDQPHPTREELFAYRDGELSAERRTVLEAHVVACRACREAIDEVSALEAALRSRPDDVGDAYYERLTTGALARAAAVGPIESRGERRKSVQEADWETKRARAPRPAWPVIASAVSAMAAVVVVVVVLTRQGAVWRQAPPVQVLERSAGDAGRGAAGRDTTAPPATPRSSRPDGEELAATRKKDSSTQIATDAARRGDEERQQAPMEARSRDEGEALSKIKSQADEPTGDKLAQNAAPFEAQERAADQRSIGAAQAPALGGADGERESAYNSVLRRYALPPIWGPGVSDELILRAEPSLRNLYRTGGARTAVDSARVRLYLAEAARLRAGASPDSALVDEITRHYRRAAGLAKADPVTAGIAASRLREFLEEQGLPR